VDENLGRPALQRERAALDEVRLRQCIAEHGGAVYAMARRIVADQQVAEEIAQDTFVELWRRPELYDPQRGSLRTFLVVIARNKAVDAIRKLQPGPAAWGRDFENSPHPSAQDHAPQIAQRSDIIAALSRLTSLQRHALYLAFFQGLTYREVAGRLSIPEGTAKTRIRDGLRRLRDYVPNQAPARVQSRSTASSQP
jgi:RNA polymerase sigma-70 factor, ECF subfamily